ncbi:MAG TPA: NUDIX hydrolase [Candidatus Saccharimonadales bacterium]
MIEQTTIEHHIQKHIMGILMRQKYARFRDLRPENVETNLYSYHLKLLQKQGFVLKDGSGYTLGKKGALYVDRITTNTLDVRIQPKIITMLVVQNSEGELLLYRRVRQPYADQWTLPYGKVHVDDKTIEQAAKREAYEKIGLDSPQVRHVGDCYIRNSDGGEIVTSTLAHVFRFESDDIVLRDRLMWVKPHKLSLYNPAPGIERIVARTFFNDPFFFEEFEETW